MNFVYLQIEKDFYKGVILLVSRDYPALHL